MTSSNPPPVVLTIAGFDPSSGAGVTADLQTFAAHGCYGVACITALTVQNTQGVVSVHPLDAAVVRETLRALAEDFEIAAVKVGMLGSSAVAEAVEEFVRKCKQEDAEVTEGKQVYVVLDPILRSSSGARLLDEDAKPALMRLLALTTVVTPNRAEAAELSGVEVHDMASARRAAAELHGRGARTVVVTGGDVEGIEAADLLSIDHSFEGGAGKIETRELIAPRIESRSTHGTGCAFASAIVANLATGAGLVEAVARAKRFVRQAIERAPDLGKGNGPLGLRPSQK
jgi:hydroxymethylpyrimidine/phosphomethylpyrimidine kinase